MAPADVKDDTYRLLQTLQPRTTHLFPFKDSVLANLLNLVEKGQLGILPYDWDGVDNKDPNIATMYGGMWLMRDRNWSMSYFFPRNLSAFPQPFCCGAVKFSPAAMGPSNFVHGGMSAASLDTITGVFLNGMLENLEKIAKGELGSPTDWVIGGYRTVLFNLTYRAGVKISATYGFNMGLIKKEGRKCFIRGGFFEIDPNSENLDQWADFDTVNPPKGDKTPRKYAVEVDGLFIDAQDKFGKAGSLAHLEGKL